MSIHSCDLIPNSVEQISESEIDFYPWLRKLRSLIVLVLIAVAAPAVAQNRPDQPKVVLITGVRFAYPLVQKWIDGYTKERPDVQLVIEARASSDPAKYDLLIEAYEHPEEVRLTRDYVNVGRYAILPVANSNSVFARVYGEKGLNKDLINQLFFNNIFADKENQQQVKEPYTVYTRLQKAGAPIVFAQYFGFEQKDILGKSIAGSDEHLLKAVIRDSTGLTYLPLALAYDHTTGKLQDGISVLPVDLNGNGKVSTDEKFYDDLASVVLQLEATDSKTIRNVPVSAIHLSIDKTNENPEAIDFIRWVLDKGEVYLHEFGFLNSGTNGQEKARLEQLASRRLKP